MGMTQTEPWMTGRVPETSVPDLLVRVALQ